jgi:hypothetical protein
MIASRNANSIGVANALVVRTDGNGWGRAAAARRNAGRG